MREAIIAPITGTEHVVTITVINCSAHPVQIKAVGIDVDGQTIQVAHAER